MVGGVQNQRVALLSWASERESFGSPQITPVGHPLDASAESPTDGCSGWPWWEIESFRTYRRMHVLTLAVVSHPGGSAPRTFFVTSESNDADPKKTVPYATIGELFTTTK